MRKLFAGTAVALVAATGITWGATAGGSPTSFTDNIFGGGRFEAGCSDGPTPFCPVLPRDLSIGVISDTRDRIATGTFRYGIPGGGRQQLAGRVTCARLSGNQAVIGGERPRQSALPARSRRRPSGGLQLVHHVRCGLFHARGRRHRGRGSLSTCERIAA